ncbi:hypothetical protein LCGC14_2480160, partial [marine sediment metagenome]
MRQGDIILTRGSGFISRAIRRFGHEEGQEALVSHAGIFISPMFVIEALSRVVTSAFPRDFKEKGSQYIVLSPKNVPDEQRRILALIASNFSARSYGYLKIVGQMVDWMIMSNWFSSRVLTWDRYPYCSFLVAEAYRSIGMDFGVPSKSTTPDDILDFCMAHPEKYGIVGGTDILMENIYKVYRVGVQDGQAKGENE